MIYMREQDSQVLLASITRLERRLKLAGLGWVLSSIGVLVLAGWAWQPQAQPAPETLRVRQLEVVDANGTPRVVIGAPKPDPQIRGKRGKRRHGRQQDDVLF